MRLCAKERNLDILQHMAAGQLLALKLVFTLKDEACLN